MATDQRQPLEAVPKRAFVQEEFRPGPKGSVAAERPQVHVEYVRWSVGRHAALVRRAPAGDKPNMDAALNIRKLAFWILDFALPPRCAGCGSIVAEVHSFCPDCWKQIEFLGATGCVTCGLPLQATDAGHCAVCLAKPPRIARTRAAVAYGEVSRGLALRLKYGRKIAIAKTMARYMAPLLDAQRGGALLVPVPLHRGRLWQRGFNQAAIVARELSRRTGLDANVGVLKRVKRTPPLKGLSLQQRRRVVAGAFRVQDRSAVDGRTIVLVDDVLTTGSTANACARELRRAGAARVELISWARVVRPSQFVR